MTAPTTVFACTVDHRSRRSMTDFLLGHYRYDTMGSWNDASSYANNVKVHEVIPDALTDKAYEILSVEDAYEPLNDLITTWGADHQYRWQAGFNGRSSGYLVLYEGGSKPSEYKRACWDCGQRNYQADSTVCGRCHSTNMHDFTGIEVFTRPGRGVDHRYTADDYAEWSMSELRDRVEVVQSFDRICDDVVAEFITMCEDYEVVDETVLVPTTVKTLQPIS